MIHFHSGFLQNDSFAAESRCPFLQCKKSTFARLFSNPRDFSKRFIFAIYPSKMLTLRLCHRCATLGQTITQCVILGYAMPHCTMLCYAVLCCGSHKDLQLPVPVSLDRFKIRLNSFFGRPAVAAFPADSVFDLSSGTVHICWLWEWCPSKLTHSPRYLALEQA